MPEIIKIKNLGPILNIEIELRKVNILIGNQGTGKSTLAKLLIAIQNTVLREISTLQWVKEKKDTTTESFKEYLKITGIDTYISSKTEIYFENDYIKFAYKNGLVEQKRKVNKLNHTLNHYDFNYIPAERSFVINFAKNLYALIETGTQLPGLFTRFGDKFLKAKESALFFDYQDVLGIKYSFRDKDADIIILKNGKEILLSNASTAMQVSIPMLVVFDNIVKTSSTEDDGFKQLVVIEEPELNCFPETQNELIRHFISGLIIHEDEKSFYKNQLVITTHSPYILTSLNNLMYAFVVGQKEPVETGKIILKQYWINPDDVTSYMLLPDGTCENILNRKENLIKAEKIDGISSFLNEQFDALLNIELVLK